MQVEHLAYIPWHSILQPMEQQEGTSLVWVTHDQKQPRSFSNSIWFMGNQTLLSLGASPKRAFKDMQKRVVKGSMILTIDSMKTLRSHSATWHDDNDEDGHCWC